ncbi:GNAT family N-acetyltransferase [Burkholderia stabilis]|uniref:GNAT family N-acetyltransferase n=1 Tax=Burkholderia stabilis TaxID=95485 RepID=A0A4Q2A7P6_9BURK|nr:GNAT family N-acetyltransferase [Burkholderia stabilis]RXV65055.1 GNAT family N-acetyltransferase [Burkholderia stabilis]
MKRLRDSHFHRVKYLFDDSYPNLPLVHGVIEGVLPGQVYTDSEYLPTRCLVLTDAAYAFSVGLRQPDDVCHALEILGDRSEIKLVIPELSLTDAPSYGLVPVPRRQYRYVAAFPPAAENTSGYHVLPVVDEMLFRRCRWSEFIGSILGGVANFHERATVFVLWDPHTNEIVSEAFAIRSRRFVEIAATTSPSHQGRGLSTLLCNQLVHWVMVRKLQPVWSCDEINAASWRIAEKLGMDSKISYTFFKRAANHGNTREHSWVGPSFASQEARSFSAIVPELR